MRLKTTRAWLLVAVVLAAALGTPENAAGQDQRKVYLVTMHPGDALFTGFGHIAFRIVDDARGTDDVYDYGTYEADDPLLAWKFLVGSLPYYCQHTSFQDMVDWYQQDFGGIIVRELRFTPEQIDALVAQVTHDCLPENAAYAYHHFHNNCATKLRDILDTLLAGELSKATKGQPAGRSLRDLIDASMARWPFAITRWAVFGLLNWEIDRPADRWAQMFLPYYLSVELDQLHQPALPGRPALVVSREVVTGEEKGEPLLPTPTFGIIFALLLTLLATIPIILPERACRRTLGTTLVVLGIAGGFYGTLLAFSWAVSPYPETSATMTLLLLHPLHWVLIPAGIGLWRGRPRWHRFALRYLAVGAAVSALVIALYLLGVIPQRIWHYAVAALALSAPGAATLFVRRRFFGWTDQAIAD